MFEHVFVTPAVHFSFIVQRFSQIMYTNPTRSEDWVAFLSYCNSQQAMGLPWIFFEKQLPLTSLTYPFSISSLQVSKRGPSSVKYYDPQWHLLLVGCSLIGDLQNPQQKEEKVNGLVVL